MDTATKKKKKKKKKRKTDTDFIHMKGKSVTGQHNIASFTDELYVFASYLVVVDPGFVKCPGKELCKIITH